MSSFLTPTSNEWDSADWRNKQQLHNLDTNVINYLGWSLNKWSNAKDLHSNNIKRQFFRTWLGMRWEPAENPESGDAWSPRDSASWAYGFEYRHPLGIISNVPTDTNYRRIVFDTADFSGAMPVKVLDLCNPRTTLYMTDSTVRRGGDGPATDSTDGRRLYVAINLRRLDSLDATLLDDTPVLKLLVEGRRFEPDTALLNVQARLPINFNIWRTPDPTGTDITELREGRGKVLGMVNVADTTDTVIITRRMLPIGANRDITITAEIRTRDLLQIDVNGNWKPPTEHTHLKMVDMLNHGTPGANDHLIDTMTPVVWFYDSTSVAIQSISLVTPVTFDILCGRYDEDFSLNLRDEFRIVDSVRMYYRDSVHCIKPLYVSHIYGVDEFDTRDELGMVYRTHLLNKFCTSETGYEGPHFRNNYIHGEAEKRMHIMPFPMYWTSGLGYTGMLTPSPMLPYSSDTLMGPPYKTLSIRDGYMFGQNDAEFSRPYSASYETMGTTNIFVDSIYDMFGTPLADSLLADSIYERIMSVHLNVGAMASWEKSLYVAFYKNGWYFKKPKTPWIMHSFYHYRMNRGRHGTIGDSTYVHFGVWRPQTGEEVRLELSTALAFGAKGFAYDKIYDMPSRDHGGPTERTGAYDIHIEPGMITNATTRDWDTCAWATPQNILTYDSLGGDYIPVNDHWRMGLFQSRTNMAAAMRLNRCFPSQDSTHVYLGQRSIRCEMKKWHDLAMHPDFTDVMYKMLPVAWYGQGYRKLVKGNMTDLKHWIDTTKAATKMYHWTKDSASGWTNYALREEPIAERFYDYVLLDTASGTAAVQDDCVLAVINRRTAPGIIDFTRTDSINPITTFDFDALVASAPEWRYRQLGARRIVIPFKYDQSAAQPSLLHVKELSLDSAVRIDTILSDRSQFAVDFKPGQTRFFQIKRLQAIDTLNSGYLAFSTQNKMIAYPVAKADSSGYTDSIRYHMVFHRKDDDTLRNGPWTVYYQRSLPYHRDSLPLVAGLDWDPPIRLSGLTTSSVQKTDGLNRTLFYEIDEDAEGGYLDRMLENTDPVKDCCCGFPSIVVRETEHYAPKVFVVYACEDEWLPNDFKHPYFHIVENAFPDQAILDPIALNANGKSLIICTKAGNHDGGGDTLKSLAKHGTPVINASALSKMYYAWSASGSGIGAGTKTAFQDWFPAANAVVSIPTPNIITTSGDTIFGGTPLYPSLNVYSNLAQGRYDATLVWQECSKPSYQVYTSSRGIESGPIHTSLR